MGDTLYTFEVVKPILADEDDSREVDVHLDKWLWAARCYKTRTLARQAVESGKVLCNGEKVRPTKSLALSDVIVLQLGATARELIVRSLSKQRRSAPEASELYEETPASLAAREQAGDYHQSHYDQPHNYQQSNYQQPYQASSDYGQQQQNKPTIRARFLRRGPKLPTPD